MRWFGPETKSQIFQHFHNVLMIRMLIFQKMWTKFDERWRGEIPLKEMDFVVV